jgi:hypothetical protein
MVDWRMTSRDIEGLRSFISQSNLWPEKGKFFTLSFVLPLKFYENCLSIK